MTQAERLNNNKHFKVFLFLLYFHKGDRVDFWEVAASESDHYSWKKASVMALICKHVILRGWEDGQNKGKNMFPNDTALLPCFRFNQGVVRALLPLASDCIHLGCHNLDINIITLRKKDYYARNLWLWVLLIHVHWAVKKNKNKKEAVFTFYLFSNNIKW